MQRLIGLTERILEQMLPPAVASFGPFGRPLAEQTVDARAQSPSPAILIEQARALSH